MKDDRIPDVESWNSSKRMNSLVEIFENLLASFCIEFSPDMKYCLYLLEVVDCCINVKYFSLTNHLLYRIEVI